jgi:hypothetical protein
VTVEERQAIAELKAGQDRLEEAVGHIRETCATLLERSVQHEARMDRAEAAATSSGARGGALTGLASGTVGGFLGGLLRSLLGDST